MIPIVCVDDRGGTLFNGRRQSQDRLLCRRLLDDLDGRELWMNAYSRRQFGAWGDGRITVDEDFLAKAPPGAYCFVEGQPLAPFLERMEGLILIRWNRVYPADTYLDLSLTDGSWRLADRVEFPGSSHEKITKEVYLR